VSWWQRIWRFVRARLDRGSELGLRLTLTLALLAVAIWAFSGLLEDVLEAETLVRWDLAANEWFHVHEQASVIRFFQAVTQLGQPVMWMLVLLVTVWLVSRHDRLLLWAWLFANGGGLLLQWVLKTTVHRNRPEFAAAHLRGTSYSFPSGHTMTATIGYFMLAHIACTIYGWRGRARMAAYGTAAAIALAVAMSRLVLSVHFPSDVVAGLAAGAGWLAVCFAVLDVVRWRTSRNTPENSTKSI
jgi:membrane-associated phospholipid phosphatase